MGGTAPEVSYADELVSVAATRRGLLAYADIVFAGAIILGLRITKHELRVFSQYWTPEADQQSKAPQKSLVIYFLGWRPASVQMKR